jgi:hypothetical protein
VSSNPRPVLHSKFWIPITAIGLVLIGVGLIGFIYAFWPARTNIAEIDVGTKLKNLSMSARGSFSDPRTVVDEALLTADSQPVPLIISASLQQQPTPERVDLIQPGVCKKINVPDTVKEGRTRLNIGLACDDKRLDPSKISAQWVTDAGKITPEGPTTLVLDTRGLVGKRVTLTGTVIGCGRRPCTVQLSMLVVEQDVEERLHQIVVEVRDDSGKAVPGAAVTVGGYPTKYTSADGLAEFTELKNGTYSISVVAKGFSTFSSTRELSGSDLRVPASLVREEPPPSSPSPSPSENPSPSPSASASAPPSPSASASESTAPTQPSLEETHTPQQPSATAHPSFAPGENGKLTVSWPINVSSGWPNLCEVRYEPPAGGLLAAGYDIQASFFLTETNGLVDSELTSPFQPLDRNTRTWTIPVKPTGPDGSVVTAQFMMRVKLGSGSAKDIHLQALQSTVVEPPLTRNETLGGSTISAVLGFGLLGVGRLKKSSLRLPTSPETTADERRAAAIRSSKAARSEGAGSAGAMPGILVALLRRLIARNGVAGGVLPGSDTRSSQATEPARYTDVTIYEGNLFRSDDLEDETKVPDDVPLVANNLYTLEVAIRLERTGVQSDVPAEREVENPRKAEETLTIHILATPLEGFKIKERLDTIKWRHNEDSESALFQLEIDPLFEPTRPGSIEIRILDQMLNLLDIVNLEVAIAAHKDASLDTAIPLRRLTWLEKESGKWTLTTSSIPRLANIHIRPVTGGFTFDFTFKKPNGTTVSVLVFRNISSEDLNNLLAGIRDFWTRLVITNYSRKLTVSSSTYDSYLRELRDLGIKAWLLLFDSRKADYKGASENIAQLLASLTKEGLKEVQELIDSTDDHTLQITYDADFGDFIFPWSILHPPSPKETTVDPLSFWGARYRIEQVTKRPKKDRIDDRPVNVLFALDPSFGDSPSQKKMFEDYQTAAQGDLTVSGPISDRRGLVENLIRNPSVHLLYFYCHGYAASRPGLLTADGVQSLKQRIEEIRKAAKDEDSATATALEKLMELTSKMAGESWIYLGDSEIKETDLRLLEFFSSKRPIVFLNMCQSADLVPSMSSGLVHLFLDHNASAVVGTESPMTSVFADAFARMVLDALFAGDNIGTALWKARRHFLTEQRNPLGLAYTLYGRVDANLCNANKSFVIPVSANSAGPVLNTKL